MSALNRVADALLKYPGTRDNDRMLCSMVWRDELIADGRDVNEMYAPDFFLAYLHTITRYLNVSERTTYRYLECFREIGYEVIKQKDLRFGLKKDLTNTN